MDQITRPDCIDAIFDAIQLRQLHNPRPKIDELLKQYAQTEIYDFLKWYWTTFQIVGPYRQFAAEDLIFEYKKRS